MMKPIQLFIAVLLLAAVAGYVACNNPEKTPDNPTPGIKTPPAISYSIVATYPHDTSSYTEGLLFYKGGLYESTGNYGVSKLLEVDLTTGKAKRSLSLDSNYFGEGIVILNDTIYQLTYKENTGFVYTLKDFKKVRTFQPNMSEGWGMTTNGKELIATDGSGNLYFYDPATYQLLRTQGVTFDGAPTYNLNEIEYVNGFIYANQWQTPNILKIDINTGEIVGLINLQQTWDMLKQKYPAYTTMDVPNGIAFDSTGNKLYVTGKHWPELYEIKLAQ